MRRGIKKRFPPRAFEVYIKRGMNAAKPQFFSPTPPAAAALDSTRHEPWLFILTDLQGSHRQSPHPTHAYADFERLSMILSFPGIPFLKHLPTFYQITELPPGRAKSITSNKETAYPHFSKIIPTHLRCA